MFLLVGANTFKISGIEGERAVLSICFKHPEIAHGSG